jgi:isopentenyl-diphosphate delta-isomerase
MKQIQSRKADHIEIAAGENVVPGYRYWDDVHLVHESLPEVDLEDVDTSTVLFGRKLRMPLVVTAITGGFHQAERINRNLAEACAELGVGMGIGSQRAALENGADESYTTIKDYDIPLKIGNIGAPQLIAQRHRDAMPAEDLGAAMDMIGAHVIAIHLNFLQEAAQPEGDTRAAGCLDAIRGAARCHACIVKETGAGISRRTAMRLKGTGIVGMDIAGMGGTSFSAVEMHRSRRKGQHRLAALGETLSCWGIPAPVSLVEASVGLPLIASGGIENGRQAAAALALGADSAGIARAVLKDAMESAERVKERLRLFHDELAAAMFLTGCRSVADLAKADIVITGRTKEWMEARELWPR